MRAGEHAIARSVARRLLPWFRRHRRDLPWRRTRDPYAIWISEAMLQQTQVATVIPYYERFMRRFPNVQALAAAPPDDVLRMWSGLGYYARGRNLHAAAKAIVGEFGGEVPADVASLRTLPGVGAYTAGAVSSIAFGKRAAVVDGNVARVIARLFAIRGDLRGPATRRRIWEMAEAMLPRRSCGDFNQALMELGAMVCVPSGPACLVCPLRAGCRANRLGATDVIPRSATRATVRAETHVVVAIDCAGKWLFVRRPEDGLWGGLWELPSERAEAGAELSGARRVLRRFGGASASLSLTPFVRFEQQLTHRRITFVGFVCRSTSRRKVENGQWRSLSEVDDLGFSRAMRRVLEGLRGHLEGATARAAPA
jgi:A/G-specific adenine glycosylase